MALLLTLEATAYTPNQLLSNALGKIVLAGRSNVGKSSLLNALGGKALAKISSRPGKTQSINYYRIESHPLYLIDLPGYGYAEANQERRRAWGHLMDCFFEQAKTLLTVCVLLDARLPPQDNDIAMIAYARDSGFSVQGILTKADKCKHNVLVAHQRIWQATLEKPPLVTSVKTKVGLQALRSFILSFAPPSDGE